MPRVIISTGHTEQNPGTQANGLSEYALARSISKKVLPYIRLSGVISLAVPPNLDLFRRLEWINKTGYDETTNDLIVEIHVNDGGNRGVEIWYEGQGNNNSQRLAESILSATTTESGLSSQGAKSEFEHELGSIPFLHETLPIACIIECGYIDNQEDANFLKEEANLEKIAKGIAKGILSYLGVPFKDLPAVATPEKKELPTKPPTVAPVSSQLSPVPPVARLPQPVQNTQISQPPLANNSPLPANPQNDSFKPLPTREERKKVIQDYYIKVLGREPNQNDLNYFLNIGIKEDDLIKKMVESQEHSDLVKSRHEVIEAKKKYNDQNVDYSRLKTRVADQDTIIENLQQTINQKNLALNQMQQRMNNMIYRERSQAVKSKQMQSQSKKYKGSFVDKLFKAFSDIFE